MQLKPQFLPVGSIVEYNLGDEDIPNWQPIKLDWQDLKRLQLSPRMFNHEHRPIPLTEKILTEWCLAKKYSGNDLIYFIGDLTFYFKDGKISMYDPDRMMDLTCKMNYLHQLQLCYQGNTQTVLPIQIK